MNGRKYWVDELTICLTHKKERCKKIRSGTVNFATLAGRKGFEKHRYTVYKYFRGEVVNKSFEQTLKKNAIGRKMNAAKTDKIPNICVSLDSKDGLYKKTYYEINPEDAVDKKHFKTYEWKKANRKKMEREKGNFAVHIKTRSLTSWNYFNQNKIWTECSVIVKKITTFLPGGCRRRQAAYGHVKVKIYDYGREMTFCRTLGIMRGTWCWVPKERGIKKAGNAGMFSGDLLNGLDIHRT